MKHHFTVLAGAVKNTSSFGALVLLLACTQTAQAQPLQDARPGLGFAAAMSAALSGNPSVLLARTQEEAAQGAAQTARGTFDFNLNAQGGATRANDPLKQSDRTALLQNGFDLSYSLSDTMTTQAGATKLFTNGLQASLVAAYTTSMSNIFPASSTPRQSIGALTFELRVPMLRNSGNVTAAPLRAAELEALAARGDLEFAVSNIVLSSALGYWDYLAKTQRLTIARNSERRGEESLDELRKLIAADELPQAEINLGLASQNDRRGARIAAEQALLESRRTLGRALGFSAEATMAIGELVDGFPEYSGVTTDSVARREALIARALEMRSDLVTLRQRQEAAQILFDAARKNELPQLDLVLGVTQSGLAEGKSPAAFGPGFGQNFGQGYSGNLIFQMPLGNNAARGLIRQQAALVEAQRIRINELGHAISGSIETSSYAIVRALEQLKEADAAVKTYAVGLANERTKRRLGLSTLIDILNVEDRYNNALLSAVQARQAYASAIAQFRFEAGMLLSREGDSYTARIDELLTPTASVSR